MTILSDRTYRTLLGLGAAMYAVTALTNLGIVAIDDYASVMRRFLPAQNHSVADIVQASGFRSPVPVVLHFWLARLGYALGLEHPLNQLRFNLLILGLLAFALMTWAGYALFARYEESARQKHREVFALLLGFYVLAPVAFTRPMIESLAAPWVLAGAAAAALYFRDGGRGWLLASVGAVTMAAMMRPQAGVVFLALPILVAMRRRWMDVAVLAAAVTVCFVASGLADVALGGGFHQSLRTYVRYNLTYSSTFGVTPWYTFVLLFLGLSLPPVFLARYRGMDWRACYQPLLPALLMFAVFLAAHSVVPHKEERFVIPALPLFLLLLTPLAVHLLEARRQRWRVALFAIANGIGLVLVVTTPPQRNVLGLARWLDQRPGIDTVVMAQDNVLLPAAFIGHPVVRQRREAVDQAGRNPIGCNAVIASLATTDVAARLIESPSYREVARFSPGPLEAAIVWLNPRHNARRGPILVFAPAACTTRQ